MLAGLEDLELSNCCFEVLPGALTTATALTRLKLSGNAQLELTHADLDDVLLRLLRLAQLELVGVDVPPALLRRLAQLRAPGYGAAEAGGQGGPPRLLLLLREEEQWEDCVSDSELGSHLGSVGSLEMEQGGSEEEQGAAEEEDGEAVSGDAASGEHDTGDEASGVYDSGMPHQTQTPRPLMRVAIVAMPPPQGLLPPPQCRELSVKVMPTAAAASPLLTESPAHLRQMEAARRRLSRLTARRPPLPLLGLQSASRTHFTPGAAAALAATRSSHMAKCSTKA